MYCAYITRIENLRKHGNADRLQCGECFGNTVIVDLNTQPNELGVYFPVDGKLGVEYAAKNDLLRRKDENGKPAGGYLDPEKRNIKALKLRGEKSGGSDSEGVRYEPISGHFMQEIDGRLYDVTGDVTGTYGEAETYDWQTYVLADSSNYARIYRDSVLMEGD